MKVFELGFYLLYRINQKKQSSVGRSAFNSRFTVRCAKDCAKKKSKDCWTGSEYHLHDSFQHENCEIIF